MDLKDRLDLLKRERQSRSRAQKVRDTWEKIDREDDLPVKDKLQKLISLTGSKKDKPSARPSRPLESAARVPIQHFENSYNLGTRYGRTPLGLGLEVAGETLSFLSHSHAFLGLDLSSALFLDLETTGLAGGTGTVPFLVGMGFYDRDRFRVFQYFLGDLAEEERMISDVGRFLAERDFRSVVTYNGKAFDIPILETRFILYREPFPLVDLPHLDFLFTARSLWKHKYESCRLFHLAREIVRADRDEDIPSSEIPPRYFEFLRTGDFSLMEPVIYHNQEDLLSLLGLVISGAMVVSERGQEFFEDALDALDLYGVGKIYEHAGDVEKSAEFFERALQSGLSQAVALKAKKTLSYHFKKNKRWDKAITMWQEMTSLNQLYSYRELSMYYEHKEKDYGQALRIATEGLALAMDLDSNLSRDFARRLDRLNQKIKKQSGRV